MLVNRARRALGDPASIVTGAGGYALGDCTVDVAEFLDALARARALAHHDPADALVPELLDGPLLRLVVRGEDEHELPIHARGRGRGLDERSDTLRPVQHRH